ncbi:MAG: TerB family tellurite resistance protein, partial [Pseudomonadales bacterium]|nr:TerB family tellurite resistance protein [Pseudomonadales bacterium]
QQEESAHKLQLATAALLYELLKTDSHIDEQEIAVLTQVLQSRFGLSAAELAEIVALAETEAQQATSLYEFTTLINTHYDYSQKVALIDNMWQVAFADQHLDKYEESLIRKIADLIYVSHSDFIRTKLAQKSSKSS